MQAKPIVSQSKARLLRLALVAAILAVSLALFSPQAHAAGVIDAKLDPALVTALDGAAANTPLEVIIVFSDTTVASQVQAIASTFYQMEVLPMASAVLTPNQIDLIAQWPEVYSITLNQELDYFTAESISYIGADQVWSTYGQTGGNVGVAVIDSGIDGAHGDLLYGYQVVQNVKIVPNGPAIENVPVTDNTSGHGTHVAGIIGGAGVLSGGYYKGVAPDVDLIGLGSGEAIAILSGVQAYDWVLANHDTYNIRVVNNSWGSSGGSLNIRNPIVIATYEAYRQGILSVFAAGNDGGYDILNPYSLAPWVLSVAAGDKSGNLADFSSRGVPGDSFKHPDIMAPGVDIYAARCSCIGVTATDPFPNPVNPAWTVHYTALSGTSMATPHVAGAAALLFSGNPQLSPDQAIDLLVNNVTPHVANYELYEAGHGYLNALAAYEASRTTTGNLAAFLAGEQQFEINNVLGIDPGTAVYDSVTHTGFVLAGATGVSPANVYTIEYEDDALFIEIDLTWDPQDLDAFDLEVVDSAGNLVVSSGEGLGQSEHALFIPTPGETYQVRVVSFAAVYTSYELTITRAYNGN